MRPSEPELQLIDEEETEAVRAWPRKLFLVTAVIAICAFIFAQISLKTGQTSGEGRIKPLMAEIRAEVIDRALTPEEGAWPLETDTGEHFTLNTLPRDTLVFVNFWATWCPPCREEMPSMLQLREQMREHRFLMLAVSYDETWVEIRDFFQNWLGRQPIAQQLFVLRDSSTAEGNTLRERFGTTALPDTYVIYNGRVVARFVNTRNWVEASVVRYFKMLAPKL